MTLTLETFTKEFEEKENKAKEELATVQTEVQENKKRIDELCVLLRKRPPLINSQELKMELMSLAQRNKQLRKEALGTVMAHIQAREDYISLVLPSPRDIPKVIKEREVIHEPI